MQIGEDVYGFSGLPFGWAHSPVLAQEILVMYLSMEHPDEAIVIQYVDDILAFSTDRRLLVHDTRQVAHALEQAECIVSPKSELTPTPEIQWMGKRINGDEYRILSEPDYLASLLMGLVGLVTKGYT